MTISTTQGTYAAGVTDAYFEPRNSWGGAAIHAVREIDYVSPQGTRYGKAVCGASVQEMVGARVFDIGGASACQRCAKAVTHVSNSKIMNVQKMDAEIAAEQDRDSELRDDQPWNIEKHDAEQREYASREPHNSDSRAL